MRWYKNLVLPLSWLYGNLLRFRHFLYDRGFFKSCSFNIPLICIGNLSFGGSGKTPMTEFLLTHLGKSNAAGVLSRGYGRKSKGFYKVDKTTTADRVGDEPWQIARKFPNALVSVNANRCLGVRKMLDLKPDLKLVLLDDAFQHRRIKAGFNILLTAWPVIFTDDYLAPVGYLRDLRIRAAKASQIVVTKCPPEFSEMQMQTVKTKIRKYSTAPVFFSTLEYDNYVYKKGRFLKVDRLQNKKFTLVTGIAKPMPLVNYLKNKGFLFDWKRYKDHHIFTDKEIVELGTKNLIVTTEKDYARLHQKIDKVCYLPIGIKFLKNEKQFISQLANFVKS